MESKLWAVKSYRGNKSRYRKVTGVQFVSAGSREEALKKAGGQRKTHSASRVKIKRLAEYSQSRRKGYEAKNDSN